MRLDKRSRLAALGGLLALVVLPAPLLPPWGVAGGVQSLLGVSWKAAYLLTAVGLHVVTYGALGVVAAYVVGPGSGRKAFLLRLAAVPVAVVALALLVRSIKLGHIPLLQNALVPAGACATGVLLGLLFRRHGTRATLVGGGVLALGLAWALLPFASAAMRSDTQAGLERLAAAPTPAAGDERFVALVRAAFDPSGAKGRSGRAAEHNRAAILALGIAIGHERLARYAGQDRDAAGVRAATALRAGTTLRGREDWARHFCVSAALAVVESPLLSDVGGTLKEELDALTPGSGFSFADLAADRAGVRFAEAATASEGAAEAMSSLVAGGLSVDDVFPSVQDLPENLTVEQFRSEFGGVGSRRYRDLVAEIERRLDRCRALSPVRRQGPRGGRR